MQVSLENTANLERRMTVNVPAARLNEVVENRLQEIARTSNMKGFRKGKVPTKVIEQRSAASRQKPWRSVRMTLGEAVREKNCFCGNRILKPEKTATMAKQFFRRRSRADFGTMTSARRSVLKLERRRGRH